MFVCDEALVRKQFWSSGPEHLTCEQVVGVQFPPAVTGISSKLELLLAANYVHQKSQENF